MAEPIDIGEFIRRASRWVDRVAGQGRDVVVQRGGRPVAALISAADYQTLQRLKAQRLARFRRDLELIHRAAEEATLVNSFSEEHARDVVKKAQSQGRVRGRAEDAAGHGLGLDLPHFHAGPPLPALEATGPAGVPRMMLDTHLLLTYLVGGGKEVHPLLDAWAEGRLEVLVPRFLLRDLRGAMDELGEQGRLDPEAADCLLELLAREGEPVADPLLPPGVLPGWRGRLN